MSLETGMKALGEVLEGRQLPVKVARNGWNVPFTVVYVIDNVAFGFTSMGNPHHYVLSECSTKDWHLYTEPKKKRVLYQAVFKYAKDKPYAGYFIGGLYENEEEARSMPNVYGDVFVKLLTDRPIEVEE